MISFPERVKIQRNLVQNLKGNTADFENRFKRFSVKNYSDLYIFVRNSEVDLEKKQNLLSHFSRAQHNFCRCQARNSNLCRIEFLPCWRHNRQSSIEMIHSESVLRLRTQAIALHNNKYLADKDIYLCLWSRNRVKK